MRGHKGKLLAGIVFVIILSCFIPGKVYDETSYINSYGKLEQALEKEFEDGEVYQFQFGTKNLELKDSKIQKALREAARKFNLGNGKWNLTANVTGNITTWTLDTTKEDYYTVYTPTNEMEAYQDALQVLKDMDYSARFYDPEYQYVALLYRVREQHVEYSYFLRASGTGNTHGDYILFEPYDNIDDIDAESEKIRTAEQKAEQVVGEIITDKMTDREKLLTLHNYICDHCAYDEDAFEAGQNDMVTADENAFNAYGCLIEGSCVCEGYAAAMNLLASKCGIRSISVVGSSDGYGHAWNYVKADGRCFYIDTTWDDEDVGYTTEYFDVTEEHMKESYHSWSLNNFSETWLDYN